MVTTHIRSPIIFINESVDKSDPDSTIRSRLWWPRLCQGDNDGNVLVADTLNNRFLVLSATGEWYNVKLDHKIIRPWDAVYLDERFYVITDNGGLYMFE